MKDEFTDADFSMRKAFYEESVKHANKILEKEDPKFIDRFLEYWWPEFLETVEEFGFDKSYIEGLNPDDFRFYYDQGYGPHTTFMMELHWI